jgi:hypothetical protein
VVSGELYFLTFGAGGVKYESASRRLAAEARSSGLFTRICCWNESDLTESPYLTRSDLTFIRGNARGYGYWLWKPIIILTLLDQMMPNDYLIYLDAGCELNLKNSTSREKLFDYCEKARSEGLIAFKSQFPVRAWTKKDLLIHAEFESKSEISKQIEAGALIIFNCPDTKKFLREWLLVMRLNDYRMLDDSPSEEQNYPEFQEHRHDQAVFTVLYLNSGRTPLGSETFFGASSHKWRKDGKPFPFWASRNISRWPRHRPGMYGMLFRRGRQLRGKTLAVLEAGKRLGKTIYP